MTEKRIYLLPLLAVLLLFACRKEKGEHIDYNVLTEQRLMEVSEQANISTDDILSLERLLEKVTDAAVKTRLSGMLDGVKIIKEFIPGLEQLRTNPDINFQESYAKLETQLKQVSDLLPRKGKLQIELEAAKANYNTQEYEYPAWIVNSAPGAGLGAYLASTHGVMPVTGKPNRFLRSDIEKVDKLVFYVKDGERSVPMSVIKTFKGLKELSTRVLEDTVDLNSLGKIERLTIEWKKVLKIDSLQNLKTLALGGEGNWGETLDFTDKYPLLETIWLSHIHAQKLTTVLLPDKQHLVSVHFDEPRYGVNALPNIRRLVIEGKEINDFNVQLGSATNRQIDEVKLSGFGGTAVEGQQYSTLGLSGHPDDDYLSDQPFVSIKKLELSDLNMELLSLGRLDLPGKPDLSVTPKLIRLELLPFTVKGVAHTINDLQGLDKVHGTLEYVLFDYLNYPEGTFDITPFTALKGGIFRTNTSVKQPLKKLFLTQAQSEREDPGDGSCDGCGFRASGGVELIVQ